MPRRRRPPTQQSIRAVNATITRDGARRETVTEAEGRARELRTGRIACAPSGSGSGSRSGSRRRRTSGSACRERTTEAEGRARELLLLLVANGMEGDRRSGRKLLLLPCVAAGLEGARHGFWQLFVEVGMDGGQGSGVQVLLLVPGENEVGRLRVWKLLLLVATGTENTALTINR